MQAVGHRLPDPLEKAALAYHRNPIAARSGQLVRWSPVIQQRPTQLANNEHVGLSSHRLAGRSRVDACPHGVRNYASLSYSNRANRLECQSGVHGNFDPQRLSGALANRANAVTGQMATWREWRAWRREFKSLGIRQVKEREAHSIWHEEKQQAARWWLREQELLPYVLAALALKEREAHSIWHEEKQQA